MILAILQARYSSSRLPGKVMKPVAGEPMLARQIERLRRSKRIERLIVATSTDVSDEPVAQLCQSIGVEWVRGSLDDVLDRFYQAAKPHQPKHVVRLTGDCPLTDPELIDRVIDHYLAGEYDYACNCLQPSYPDGLDVEVFRFSALEEAWKEAKLRSQREHVTPFIHQQPQRYKLADYRSPVDLSSLRWTVDHRADYELVSRIYEALYPSNPAFTTQDILDLLEARPELKTWNTQHSRNEGYGQSLEEDRKYFEP